MYPACDTARDWLGIGPQSVWSASEELPMPAAPAPAPSPRAPPPPAARTACGIEESWAPRPDPSGGEGTRGFLGEGLGARWHGARCRRGLERVLRKTGPRTKRNPRCELVDRRRLLPVPRSQCHLRTLPPVVAQSVPRPRSGWPEVTSAGAPQPLARAPGRPGWKAASGRGPRLAGRRRRGGAAKGTPGGCPHIRQPSLMRSTSISAFAGVISRLGCH